MKLDHHMAYLNNHPVVPATRAFYCWHSETGELRWGGNCEPILGCAPWHMPANIDSWLAIIHPEDRFTVQEAIRDFFLNRQPIRMEFRVRRADGRSIPVAAHAAFIADTTIIGSVARANSNTKVWESQQPNDESISENTRPDRELIRFFDLSEDLLCIVGTDGYFRRVNPNFSRVLGYSVGELISRPLLDFVHQEDRELVRLSVVNLGINTLSTHFRCRFLPSRGILRWLEWTARALPDEGLIFAVARDVTERVELETKLQLREERERAILDNTTAVIYVKDTEGRYEFINEQYAKLFGISRSGVIGKTDDEIFPATYARAFRENDKHVLQTLETLEAEEVVPQKDGIHTYISIKFPLYDGHGHAVAVAGISTDITDRLKAQDAEEQLRTARQVQQKLYPAAPPIVQGFEVASRGVSASQLCGDYFDFIQRSDRRLVAAVGDVCGHGLGPALTMVETRAAVRLLTQGHEGLDSVLSRLNHQLYHETGDSLFVSMFICEVDLDTRLVTFTGAGHVGYWLEANGTAHRLDSTGPLLGLMDPMEFGVETIGPLNSGDFLVLFTDGLTEAMNPADQQFTVERVLDLIRKHSQAPVRDIIRLLFEAVEDFAEGQLIKDDITVILFKAL